MVGVVLMALLGAAELRADTPHVLMEPGATAQLELTVSGAAELDVHDVRIEASVGTVGAVSRLGPNRFRAEYIAPHARYPHAAILVARAGLGADEQRAWLSLPLHARSVLKLATKPRASVEVEIAGRRFGPAVANGAGDVQVPVVVAPGRTTAIVRSVDRVGNRSKQHIPLEPPEFIRAWAVPVGREAVASWAEPPLQLELFVVDPRGAPDPQAPVVIADQGEVTVGAAQRPGMFRAEFRGPRRMTQPHANLRILPRKATQAASHALPIRLRAGPPTRIRVVVEPDVKTAGQTSDIQVRARAEDAHGNAVDPSGIILTTDFGSLASGTAGTTTLNVPDAFGGRRHARIRATVDATSGEAAVRLRSGPPLSAEITPPDSFVPAGDDATAHVLVRDAFGNPVEETLLQASAANAQVRAVEPLADGRFAVSLHVPESASPGEDLLSVRNQQGALLAQAPLLIAPAQKQWGVSAGVFVRGHSNLSRASGGGPLLQIAVRPGRAAFELLLQGGAQLYSPVRAAHAAAEPGVATITSLSSTSVEAGIRLHRRLTPILSVHGAATGGMRGLRSTIEVDGGAADGVLQTDTGMAPLLALAAGVNVKLGPGRGYAELQGIYGPSDVANITGNLGGGAVGVGYLLELR